MTASSQPKRSFPRIDHWWARKLQSTSIGGSSLLHVNYPSSCRALAGGCMSTRPNAQGTPRHARHQDVEPLSAPPRNAGSNVVPEVVVVLRRRRVEPLCARFHQECWEHRGAALVIAVVLRMLITIERGASITAGLVSSRLKLALNALIMPSLITSTLSSTSV